MRQAVVDNALWAAGIGGDLFLLAVLYGKGRWRRFPAFTALILLPVATSLVLLSVRWLNGYSWYAPIYRLYAVADFLIQLAIVAELARVVLRPTGTWVHDARKQFLLSATAGTLLALVLAYLVAPPARTLLERLELRANLFTSLLICELIVAVSLASNRLGLGWRNHVMAIGQAFTAWSVVATLVDSLHSYFGTALLYNGAEYFKSCAYMAALLYWSVRLWKEEPDRQAISPQLRKFILALHERVQYDLGEAER